MLFSDRICRATYIPVSDASKFTANALSDKAVSRMTGVSVAWWDRKFDVVERDHPIACSAASAAVAFHYLFGAFAGVAFSVVAPVAVLVQFGLMGSSLAAIGGGLMAAGAVAHAAAPLVMGVLGKEDKNPQGLCAKLAWGALDGLGIPVMMGGYIGSRIGRLFGAASGLVVGAGIGVARQGAIWTHETLLQPLYEKRIDPILQCRSVQSAKATAHTVTQCPLPNYSLSAHEAGLKLLDCFRKLTGQAAPSLPANGNAATSPEKPRQTDTGGPQNG